MTTTAATAAAATAATTPTTAGSTAARSAAAAKTSLAGDFNTFLNMLTTQLQHQDPLSPMDSTQFTSQLVQYSSVEQEINTNSNLATLISLQQANQTSQATSYLNQNVEISGSSLPLQNGNATYSYTLPSTATSCNIQIADSTGATVYSTTGDTSIGSHSMTWNGQDSSGTQLADGIYTLTVTATNADNTAMTTTTTTTGQVTKVTNDATNGTTLEIDAGTSGGKVTTTPSKIVSVTANNNATNAELTAANAQYQAAQAQLKALTSSTTTTSTTPTTTSTSSTAG